MTDSRPLVRVAVVGIGWRAFIWAVPALLHDPRYQVVALCDANLKKLKRVVKEAAWPDFPVYASLADCLAREPVDAVIVTTPDGTHADVAVPALQAGKYVFVDKPLEITASRCRAVVEADRAAGGKTLVGFNLRFCPLYAQIRELVAAGAVGDILTMQADEYYNGGRTFFRRWNRLRHISGGLWITKASHDFDILQWMAGKKPVAVSAAAALSYYTPRPDAPRYCGECARKDTCPDSFFVILKSMKPEVLWEAHGQYGQKRPDVCLFNSDKDTFDHGSALVEFEGGLTATFTCNVVTGYSNRRLRIAGTRGLIDGDLLTPQTIRLVRRDPVQKEDIPVARVAGGHGGADAFLLNHFYEVVTGQTRPRTTPADAMTAVLIGLAATRSGDEQRRVTIREIEDAGDLSKTS